MGTHLRPLLTLCLCSGALAAGAEDASLAERDQALAQSLLTGFSLAMGDTVQVRQIIPDPDVQGRSTRVDQFHRGVQVLGGEAVLHLSGANLRSVTDAFVRGLQVDPTATVPASEALATAVADLGCKGPFAQTPRPELRVTRLEAEGDRLVWRVPLRLENGPGETVHMDYLVDAQDGRILRRRPVLQTGRAAVGQGLSQYSGTVTLNTTRTPTGFELRDWTRGRTGNVVLNMDNGTDAAAAKPFASTTNIWGDGLNYTGGLTTGPNGETAAVDAAFGLQATWDYYAKVFGRKGIDGQGTAVPMRVHYANAYDNAFWSESCRCVTLGDGSYYKSLGALDVIAHELSHGVCQATAGLNYWGESGGLNEANSDIHGCLVEFHARGGYGETIGSWGGNWTMAEDIARADHPRPLRYLYKPSKDGISPDHWTPALKRMDVHLSSGPMNRCFYFLSQGSSPAPRSDYYSCFLPKGMEGIGNDRAARVWFRAVTHYLTSTSDYHDARKACLQAAQDLYGPGGAEERAVWNAFHAINVGPAWEE